MLRICRLILLIAFICVPPSVLASTGGVDALQRFYTTVHDLETQFEQVQTDEGGKVLQKSSGTFLLLRPARFRWEYTEPYRQTMVSDGQTFWFHDRDLAQVTRRRMADALQGTPALLLSGGPALQQQFSLEDQGQSGELQWVRLQPKGDGDFTEIRLGLKGGAPQAMELHDKLGQITRIKFTGLRVNPGLKAEQFAFRIPQGAEVVDDAGPKPAGQR